MSGKYVSNLHLAIDGRPFTRHAVVLTVVSVPIRHDCGRARKEKYEGRVSGSIRV